MARVIVLGGGFGGLAGATELRARLPSDDEVVVVAASDRFFMGFAKLWDLAGARPLAGGTRPLSALADRGIRFVQAEASHIDPASRTVAIRAGGADQEMEGDALLVALGSVPAPAHLDLIRSGAGHNLYDAAALAAVHAAIDGVASGRVVVAILGGPFKCPPAPYEAALIVDQRLRERGVRRDVSLAVVTPQPMTLPAAGPDASRVVAEGLSERDITLLDRRGVAAAQSLGGGGHALRFADGETLDYSVLLAVPGEVAPSVLAASPLVGSSGFVEPDPRTLATGFDRVYAVGDCTSIPTATAQLPKAGVFAAAQGRVAAANIARDLHGGEAASFDGHGLCFLEFPERLVATVEGDFFAEPRPDVRLTPASTANFERKQAYEHDGLSAWLG